MKDRKKRTLKKNTELYNYYYKKSGFYKTLLKSVLKLSFGVVLFVAAFVLVTNFLIDDLEGTFISVVESVPFWMVYVMFFLSDSVLLSIVPPDLFILWADSFDHKFLILFFLGLVSYGAGLFSYFIGLKISNIPVVNKWLKNKFATLVKSVHKWGGAFVIVAAVLPVPWSPALIVTGMMRYSFVNLSLVALTRFIRFYIYGLILFNAIDIF